VYKVGKKTSIKNVRSVEMHFIALLLLVSSFRRIEHLSVVAQCGLVGLDIVAV
jgi:hypothetical protein